MNKRFASFLVTASASLGLLLTIGCGGSNKAEETAKPAKDAKVEGPAKKAVDNKEMVFIPGGKCTVGGPADNPVTKFSSPAHDVDLKPFWIDKYEVTFEQFMQFVAETGYATKGDWRKYFDENKAQQPVFNVILEDAKAYAKWAGKRLPTQEEWEKAASWNPKTSKAQRYPWGDTWKDGQANCGTSMLQDVGQSAGDVSAFGVNDMLGNVYEWTTSFYDAYPGCKAKDPNFPKKLISIKGASCYIRGEGWHLAARSAFPANSILGIGFRCAKDAAPGDESKAQPAK